MILFEGFVGVAGNSQPQKSFLSGFPGLYAQLAVLGSTTDQNELWTHIH